MAAREPKVLCVGCLLDAIAKYHVTLMTWLDAGGDTRLIEFEPLSAWGPVIHMIADSQLGGPQTGERHDH